MMQVKGGNLTSEHPPEQDLPACGRHQIGASDHERDALAQVVDDDRELVGPVTITVLEQEVAALLGWYLLE